AVSSTVAPSRISAVATVSRLRRTYSEIGNPASVANIRRKWYSEVVALCARAATSTLSVSSASMASIASLHRCIVSPPFTSLTLRTRAGPAPDNPCPFRSSSRAPIRMRADHLPRCQELLELVERRGVSVAVALDHPLADEGRHLTGDHDAGAVPVLLELPGEKACGQSLLVGPDSLRVDDEPVRHDA